MPKPRSNLETSRDKSGQALRRSRQALRSLGQGERGDADAGLKPGATKTKKADPSAFVMLKALWTFSRVLTERDTAFGARQPHSAEANFLGAACLGGW
jgi:hypothetical protein